MLKTSAGNGAEREERVREGKVASSKATRIRSVLLLLALNIQSDDWDKN